MNDVERDPSQFMGWSTLPQTDFRDYSPQGERIVYREVENPLQSAVAGIAYFAGFFTGIPFGVFIVGMWQHYF